MIVSDLAREASKLAKAYFPEWDVNHFNELLIRFPHTARPFIQITQQESLPQLEVGYLSNLILVDYTYREKVRVETFMSGKAVRVIQFTKESTSSRLLISAGGSDFFRYSASSESSQRSLELYARHLQKVILS